MNEPSHTFLELFGTGTTYAVLGVVPVFGTGDHLRIHCVVAPHIPCYAYIKYSQKKFFFSETGIICVSLAVLELILYTRLD